MKQVMLQPGVSELDKLIASDLIFTNHPGHIR